MVKLQRVHGADMSKPTPRLPITHLYHDNKILCGRTFGSTLKAYPYSIYANIPQESMWDKYENIAEPKAVFWCEKCQDNAAMLELGDIEL